MTLANKVLATTALAFGMAAANAQTQPNIEPNSTDLSKPLASSVCVKTTVEQNGLSAFDKLVAIMNARQQIIAGSGNKLVVGNGGKKEVMITASNNLSGVEGYLVSSDTTKEDRANSDGFCISPVKYSVAIPLTKGVVPKAVNYGELGVGLKNLSNNGAHVAIIGAFNQGSLFAVSFDPNTHKGIFHSSDAQGNNARPIHAFEDFDFGPKMKQALATAQAEKEKSKGVGSGTPELDRAPE